MTVGPGAGSYLEVHQASSPGWTATLNGKTLPPVTLDGWQQAFAVPAGAGGTVTMTYTPATGYRDVLIGSFVAAALILSAACWPARRRRRPADPDGEPGAVGYVVAVVAAAAALALVGGPLVVAVVAVAALGWWRRDWVPWLAFAAMCVAGIAVLTGLGHGAQPGYGAFGWPAQAAALVALAAALTPPVPSQVASGERQP
jgi:arabinofuranan 3-O-arabinosyltransferase